MTTDEAQKSTMEDKGPTIHEEVKKFTIKKCLEMRVRFMLVLQDAPDLCMPLTIPGKARHELFPITMAFPVRGDDVILDRLNVLADGVETFVCVVDLLKSGVEYSNKDEFRVFIPWNSIESIIMRDSEHRAVIDWDDTYTNPKLAAITTEAN